MKNIVVISLPKVVPSNPLHGVVQTLLSLVKEVETLGGLRANVSDNRAVLVSELLSTGLLAKDAAGNLYNPAAQAPEFKNNV